MRHKIRQRGFSLRFFQGNGSSRNSAVYLVSIYAGKSCKKHGGKARKILQNGSSPPSTILEAILLLREEAVSREERASSILLQRNPDDKCHGIFHSPATSLEPTS